MTQLRAIKLRGDNADRRLKDSEVHGQESGDEQHACRNAIREGMAAQHVTYPKSNGDLACGNKRFSVQEQVKN